MNHVVLKLGFLIHYNQDMGFLDFSDPILDLVNFKKEVLRSSHMGNK